MNYLKIKSIKSGVTNRTVYDLESPKNHNFVANGLVVHNSEFTNVVHASCNLGSINLSKYVIDGKLDIENLSKDIDTATNFLNSVIDVNVFPIENIRRVTHDIRPIGLGVMGVAHMFMKMGVPFNSKNAYDFSKKLMTYITLRSIKASIDIAKVDGKYNAFDFSTFYKANERLWNSESIDDNGNLFDINVIDILSDLKKYGVRNSCFTSIAPTGTLSWLCETSGGIEPVFSLAYARKIEKDKDIHNNLVYETVYVTDPVFESWLDENKKELKTKILEYVSNNKGSVQGCEYLTKEEQSLFMTASDLSSIEHLDSMQPWARATSLSVSKTINLPENAKPEDVGNAYIEAYKRGIIGVSVYRDGARGGVLIHEEKPNLAITKTNAPKRPNELPAEIHTFVINKQPYYVAIGFYGDDVYEIFTGVNVNDEGEIYIPRSINKGKIVKQSRGKYYFIDENDKEWSLTNGHSDSSADALTRSISTSLRHGTPLEVVVTQLEKTKGPLNSFAKAISRMIKKHIKDGTKVTGMECAECGSEMIRESGCVVCKNCGSSKCS
jgi:ribonucleoside-diphosphate reductase alpha chain